MRNKVKKYCLECNIQLEVSTRNKKKKFCNQSCSAKYNNRLRNPPTKEQKAKTSESLKKRWQDNPKNKKIIKNKCRKQIKSIYTLHSKIKSKILKKLHASCCVCGWNEGSCDIHHLYGRKCNDPHNHSKICHICPNCHRLTHEKKVDNSKLISFEEQFGNAWLGYYYEREESNVVL